MAAYAFGFVIQAEAQNSPPAPPALPPPPVRIAPAFRPVPLRVPAPTNPPAVATVPSVPVPLLQPAPPSANPPLPATPAVSAAVAAAPVGTPGALVFDAEQKDYSAKVGEATANFTFYLTNISSAEVLVNKVTTSCGCTVAKLPEQPWHLAPGTNGPINVTVDLRGKSGKIMKSISVDSTAGAKALLVSVTIPPPSLIAPAANNMDRAKNMERAKADRQSVFKSDCAECHVKPAIGKLGKELYVSGCGVCHEATHRATMVPDLHVLKHPNTRDYWTQTITEGKINSLMPAFALKNQGILTEQQISSLVDYLMTDFAKETKPAPSVSVIPVTAPPAQPRPQANAGGVLPVH